MKIQFLTELPYESQDRWIGVTTEEQIVDLSYNNTDKRYFADLVNKNESIFSTYWDPVDPVNGNIKLEMENFLSLYEEER